MSYKATLMPGDGIGPEVCKSAVEIVKAAGVDIEWEKVPLGLSALELHKSPLPEVTLESVRRTRLALKGPTGTPVGKGFKSVNVGLRMAFGLFANIRPVRSFVGVPARYDNIDLRIIRENVEHFYVGKDRFSKDRLTGRNTGIVTYRGSSRLMSAAFEDAKKHGLTKVTAVTKANIVKIEEIFLDAARDLSHGYSGIELEEKLIDNMCMQLVMNPYQFQVIAAPNLYGDILSDLCAGMIGGLGLAPGANIGTDGAVFEAVHGTAWDLAGQDKANPSAVILSAVMMLEYLDETVAANRITKALEEVLEDGTYVTGDINKRSPVGTERMTQAIIDRL